MTARYRASGGLARIALDRPPLNILDIPTSRALEAAFRRAGKDRSVRVVLLEGWGRCFSAGADVGDHARPRVRAMLRAFHGAVRALYALEKPTVAWVHGHCLGGGWELVQACDLVLAAPDARFGQPEIRLGCYSPVAAVLLPRRVGAHRAAGIVLGGGILTAREAMGMGLLNRIAKGPEALLRNLLSQSGVALACAKAALRVGEAAEFARALRASERVYLNRLARTRDMEEGVQAFLAKRPAVWKHR